MPEPFLSGRAALVRLERDRLAARTRATVTASFLTLGLTRGSIEEARHDARATQAQLALWRDLLRRA